MQSINKTLSLLIILTPIVLLSGCSSEQASIQTTAAYDRREIPQNDSVAKRFQESTPQNPTVVESAIELSEKYATLSEEALRLKQQNEDIVARNKQLDARALTLESQLQQARKELAEANDLLIEMRIELNNWKTDILGFRDEMRAAETAQLETLFRILKVLGGQVDAELTGSDSTGAVGSAASSSSRSYGD